MVMIMLNLLEMYMDICQKGLLYDITRVMEYIFGMLHNILRFCTEIQMTPFVA